MLPNDCVGDLIERREFATTADQHPQVSFVQVTGRLINIVGFQGRQHVDDAHIERLKLLPVEVDLNLPPSPASHADASDTIDLFEQWGNPILGQQRRLDGRQVCLQAEVQDGLVG